MMRYFTYAYRVDDAKGETMTDVDTGMYLNHKSLHPNLALNRYVTVKFIISEKLMNR